MTEPNILKPIKTGIEQKHLLTRQELDRVSSDESYVRMPALVEMRPEVELLLCCARICIDPEQANRIKTLTRKNIDWEYLLQTALGHKAIPLLYRSLNATCPEAVPRTVLSQLYNHFQSNARRNLFLTGELINLLHLFETHKIPVIPYKGPVLAATIYGDLSLRQFGDLDILVHQQDIERAKDLLISQGYQTAYPRSISYNYKFVHDDGKIDLLELHWRITPPYLPFRFDLKEVWERLQQVDLAGTKVRIPPPEDLLLILCVHGAKDNWRRLGWVCDVAELLRVGQGMNWRRVLAQANRLRVERMLFVGLFLTNNLLGTVIPEEIQLRMQADSLVKPLALQIRQRLISKANNSLRGIERHNYYLRIRERWRDKLSYIAYQACSKVHLNAKDRAIFPLPIFLSFLYYLLRAIRLVREFGPIMLRELRRF